MFARLTVLLFCTFLLLSGREPPWADANIAYQTTQALVDRGELHINLSAPSYFFVERAGKKYGFATLGTALGQVPSYLTYKALRKLPGLPQAPWFAFASHLSSALAMALALAIAARRAQRLGAPAPLAVLLALLTALCSICLVYARSPYGEALQTLLLTWFADLVLTTSEQPTRKRLLVTGLCGGLLLNAKLVYAPVLLIGLGCFWIAQRAQRIPQRLTAILWATLGALPGLVLLCGHNYLKTGHPLRTVPTGAPQHPAWMAGVQMRQHPLPPERQRAVRPQRQAALRRLQQLQAHALAGTFAQPPERALSRQASIMAIPRAPSSTVGKSIASGPDGPGDTP